MRTLLFIILILLFNLNPSSVAVEILSKSKLERCVMLEVDKLDCDSKVVINIAVPSGSSGGEVSIVAELVEVEENDTQKCKLFAHLLSSPSTNLQHMLSMI